MPPRRAGVWHAPCLPDGNGSMALTAPFVTRADRRLQRVSAHGLIAVKAGAGRSRLARLGQEGAARIRLPAGDGGPLEAILINTAGGMTGGDRLRWEVEVGEAAALAVTTQACEKVYRSAGGSATIDCRLDVARGGRLAWLPQETIVFDRSAMARRIDVDLAADSRLLLLEATIFGRKAMGEAVTMAGFRDRWRVRSEGRLVHAEEFSIGPDVAGALAHPALGGGATAFATVLLVADDAEGHLDAVRALIGEPDGASAWRVSGTGKLLARLSGKDGYDLRARLAPLVAMLNGRAGLPKTWSL